ncbi:MAG: hypothetical protein ACJAS4_002853 [Bacteriovoracaceae bacterium]|jgi:hypothetical protein
MKNAKKIVFGSVIGLSVGGVMLGGIVMNGVFVGAMTTLGVGLLFIKLQDSSPWLWRWLINHPLFLDMALSAALVLLLGTGSGTSVIGGAAAALFCSAGLQYFKDKGDDELVLFS